MASQTDLESQRKATDERTPLLGASAEDEEATRPPPAYQDRSTGDNEHDENQDPEQVYLIAPSPDEEEKSKRTTGWWLWRGFWAVLAIFVLAVFIKGWVDAKDTNFDLGKALKRALGGGLSGAAAMVLQVLTLMPLRTIMNYQYRFGTGFRTATATLYHDGGLGRYYQGLGAALIQGPVSRFGDTAANAGILALLESNSFLNQLPTLIKTVFASLCAAAFRMILTPIDTLKTTLQAQGAKGTAILRQRVKTNGIGSLWWGAFATAAATFVGHYPWFGTYNYLTANIPEPDKSDIFVWLLRLAFIGFCASIVSDTVSNSLRVVKTYRQVNDTKISYKYSTTAKAAKNVIERDGVLGFLGRGLKTRILANGLQGVLFSILWKLFLDLWEKKTSS
ncbi:unnamed protein product [Colletotrichum noveboracense]|uniref:Mitochondrial carrier protein n=1 Tax=Colletotrichum noveboracense TaxID=2664923 RepID=A0A9W4WD08_9PEZI|nr:unnamed protein product [Colletotrichum noveboracense]